MGNVRMRAEQINYGASNVKAALDDLDPKDLIALSARMDTIDAWKATVKTEEKTGASVEYTNALALDAVSVSADITASQDLHGYDKPWVGGAGKNKAGGTITGAYVGSSGAIGADASFDLHYGRITSGVTYTITTDDPNFVGGFFESEPAIGSTTYDGQRVVTNNKAFTAPITGYVAFRSNSGYTTAQIEVGETATSYEPYANICPITGFSSVVITDVDSESQTATVTVALGSTVYGGSLDLTSGELTITHAIVDLGTLTYGKTGNDSKAFSTNSIKTEIKPCAWSSEITTAICSQYSAETGSNVYILKTDGIFGVDANGQVYFYDSRFEAETAASIKTALSGVQLCYELAAPTAATLTAAQVALVAGYNRLSANTGNITVEAYTGAPWGGDAE